ncbi:MAG: iron-sulfur cluster assembly scaffold protein SufE [Planctomycetota bacterium]|nr:MAG: iron-sulfur cluster assembly scaffold protein SufE [Planctomycetota bacterium]
MEIQEELSQKIMDIAAKPTKRGMYTIDDAIEKGLGLATSKVRDIKIYLLVNIETDKIYDVKFFSYGKKVSVALAEVLSSILCGRVVDTIRDIKGAFIEKELRDEPDKISVSPEELEKFEIVEELIKIIVSEYNMVKSKTLALREEQKLVSVDLEEQDEEWASLSNEDRLVKIEKCLDDKVRAGLQMDGGDCQVEELKDGKELFISYSGACGSCGSSTGGTLYFIEDSLKKMVYHGITVQPV